MRQTQSPSPPPTSLRGRCAGQAGRGLSLGHMAPVLCGPCLYPRFSVTLIVTFRSEMTDTSLSLKQALLVICNRDYVFILTRWMGRPLSQETLPPSPPPPTSGPQWFQNTETARGGLGLPFWGGGQGSRCVLSIELPLTSKVSTMLFSSTLQ